MKKAPQCFLLASLWPELWDDGSTTKDFIHVSNSALTFNPCKLAGVECYRTWPLKPVFLLLPFFPSVSKERIELGWKTRLSLSWQGFVPRNFHLYMISIKSKQAACAYTCRALDVSVISPRMPNGSMQGICTALSLAAYSMKYFFSSMGDYGASLQAVWTGSGWIYPDLHHHECWVQIFWRCSCCSPQQLLVYEASTEDVMLQREFIFFQNVPRTSTGVSAILLWSSYISWVVSWVGLVWTVPERAMVGQYWVSCPYLCQRNWFRQEQEGN